MRRPYVGSQGAGRRSYTEAEQRRVVAALTEHCVGRENAVSAETFQLAYCPELEPRTVRAIVSDRDGLDYLLVNEGIGLQYVAETCDEAEGTTAKLRARARTELQRADRRDAYANEHLRRQQQVMAL